MDFLVSVLDGVPLPVRQELLVGFTADGRRTGKGIIVYG